MNDPLVIAFLQGAKWWEWKREGATMWAADQEIAITQAEALKASGTLGALLEIFPATPENGVKG